MIEAMEAFPDAEGRATVVDAERCAAAGDRAGLDAIARRWEQTLRGADVRRALGAWYTPAAMADALVASSGRGGSARRVLDPACGTGELLLAVVRAREAAGLRGAALVRGLHGLDVDPVALAIARLRLQERAGGTNAASEATWEHASALEQRAVDAVAGRFDLVVMNPPFGSPLHVATRRDDATKAILRRVFPASARGTFDRSACFVELGMRACEPGGVLAAIVPAALLSARWAASLRELCDAMCDTIEPVALEVDASFADAHVRVTGLVGVRHVEDVDSVRPSTAPLPPWVVRGTALGRFLAHTPGERLDRFVQIRASATVDEGYRWRELLQEGDSDEPPDVREWAGFVTSGCIDPFECRWGRDVQRCLGRRLLRPRILVDAMPPRRAALVRTPKLLVPGLSRVLEAFEDQEGRWCGSVGTLSITEHPTHRVPLRRVATVVQAWPTRALYRALYDSQALGGGSVPVTRESLGALPVPPAWFATVTPQGRDRGRAIAETLVQGTSAWPEGAKDDPTRATIEAAHALADALRTTTSVETLCGALDHLADSERGSSNAAQHLRAGSVLLLAMVSWEHARALLR
jgi:SAM-dependent methyltransferase